MKRLFTFLGTLFVLSSITYAQENTFITRFLGIPIDGTKHEIIQKLKAKGFSDAGPYSTADLIGEFNGVDVEIAAVTNNNKVYRIAVFDRYYSSETDIKIRFNKLCHQFENNSKYDSAYEDQSISEAEDISYEINVNSKRYQASFYQHMEGRTMFPETVDEYLLSLFTQEQIDNPTEAEAAEINTLKEDFVKFSLLDMLSMTNRSVWFMIDNEHEKYRILMFYDNELNRANGEDL